MKHIEFFPIVWIAAFLAVWAQPAEAQRRESKIGYIYPAGGQRGTTFQTLIGGRQISRSRDVLISGTGVRGRVVHGYPAMRINDADERRLVQRLYEDALKRLDRKMPPSAQKNDVRERNEETPPPEKSLTPEDVMKKYPYVDRLVDPTFRDLELVYDFYFAPRPERKPVDALGQGVLVEITVDANAEPGDRDLRLLTPNGLTAPVRFMIGGVPEAVEREPNDPGTHARGRIEIWNRQVDNVPSSLSEQSVYGLPIVLNGQVRAGDVDRFQFKARKGQKLVVDVRARYLIPYLADGVPGWFQPAISLFDPSGRKIGEAMSYRHEPDPVLLVDLPKEGVYSLEIQDSIFRGRDDFVYRITVGELPFATSLFPLGARRGMKAVAEINGWNLPGKAVSFDAGTLEPGIHEIRSIGKIPLLRPIRFVVDDLSEMNEKEPNRSVAEAVTIEPPIMINGRISDENDIDCFAFEGRKGQQIVIDVTARSVDSPLDAVVELLDPQNAVVASNDDRADSKGPNIGLETHHADPYLNVELPADGKYVVRLYDATQRGGKEFGYRLRISPPRPDFSVFCEPSSLTFRGNTQPLKAHLVRKDGFQGEVVLRTTKGSPFRIENGDIASGENEATINLAASSRYDGLPTEISMEAVAIINGNEIVRPVIAVDDMEQAFIYHHWVPAKSFVTAKPASRSK